ncbi:unnamed protein product, partial [Phaeothamnion confervicola]
WCRRCRRRSCRQWQRRLANRIIPQPASGGDGGGGGHHGQAGGGDGGGRRPERRPTGCRVGGSAAVGARALPRQHSRRDVVRPQPAAAVQPREADAAPPRRARPDQAQDDRGSDAGRHQREGPPHVSQALQQGRGSRCRGR